MEQNKRIEGSKKLLLMMLMVSGNEIVAPEELKRQTIESLKLESNVNFFDVNEDLKQVKNQEEKLAIIKGIILTHLTPSQMISLHDVIYAGVNDHLKYLKDHPEEKGDTSNPETIMDKLFESN